MQVSPYTLLGSSVLAAIERQLSNAALAWAVDWGIAGPALSFACKRAYEVLPSTALAAGAWRQCWQAEQRSVWLGWPPEFVAEMQRALFEPDDGYASHAQHQPITVAACTRRALGDLAAAVRNAAGTGMQAGRGSELDPPRAQFLRGAGAIIWQVRIGEQALHCLLDDGSVRFAACDAVVANSAPKLARIDLKHALADVPVSMRVQVGSASVGLGALLSAGVGDVIRLGTSIDAPVSIMAPSGAVMFEAYLGRMRDSVAIEVAGQN